MVFHIFTTTGGYNSAFVDFFKANFNASDHYFAFRDKGKNYSSLIGKQSIIFIDSKVKLISFLYKLYKSDQIYFHYFPLGPSLYMWYLLPFLMKKTTWIIWGSDLYYFRDRNKNFRDTVYEFIRKSLIKKVSRIACFIKGDYLLAKEIYKTKAYYQYAVYPLPIRFDTLDKFIDFGNRSNKNSPFIILLGNSATQSNNHYEALDTLRKFKSENIEIICPLSYGNMEYGAEVAEYGRAIFGDKFKSLTEFLNEEQYSNVLAKTDIAIMAHKRQQALGNILSLLYLGKKVFMSGETTSFEQLGSLGLQLFNISELHKNNFENFCNFEIEKKITNHKIIKREFSNSRYKEVWEKVLFQEGNHDKRN